MLFVLPVVIGSFFLSRNKPIKAPVDLNTKQVNFPKDLKTPPQDVNCDESFLFYEENLKTQNTKLRFENLHLKIEDKIWRLRFFFDDGDEGEIPTYQVFLEDENEYTDLIESNKNSPGPKYKEISSKESELIYQEHGYLNEDKDEFIHTENKKILKVISEKSECTRN